MIWVETIVNGILLGGLYALVGLGLGYAFGIMRIVNVAQGDFIVSAAFLGLFLAPWTPLHPLLVIFSLLAGGELFGILGVVVAVPLAAVLKVLGKFLWQRFRLWVA